MYKMQYLEPNYVEKTIILIDILTKIFRSSWQIPFTNRAPSWDNKRAAEYLNFILGGNTLGFGTLWKADGDLKVEIQQLLVNPLAAQNIERFIEKYVLDSGNRLRLFTSIAFDQGIPESQDPTMRENGFELAYNPFIGEVSTLTTSIKRDSKWIKDLSSLWACWDHGPKKIKQFIKNYANNFLTLHGIQLGETGRALTVEDEAVQLVVTKNIGAFVEILFTGMTFSTVFASSEEEAYKIFIGTNANENISLLDHMAISLNIIDHEYFRKLKVFSRECAEGWFDSCEDDTYTVLMGLLSRRINKSGKEWHKSLVTVSKRKRRRYIQLLTNKQNFEDFLCNILFPFGFRTPKTYKTTTPLLLPFMYAIYIDGLYNGVEREILFRELKLFFLTFGSMAKKFPENHAFRVNHILQTLSNAEANGVLWKNALISEMRALEAVQTQGLVEEYFNSPGKGAGQCPQLTNSTSVMCYRDAGLLFTPARKLINNILSSHRHHINAVVGMNVPVDLQESEILENAMNKFWISPDYNHRLSTSDPKSCFEHFCKTEEDKTAAALHGINAEMFQFDEGITEEILIELNMEIAKNKVDITLETIDMIKQGY